MQDLKVIPAGDFRATIHWDDSGSHFWFWVSVPAGYHRNSVAAQVRAEGKLLKSNPPPSSQETRELDPTVPINRERISRAMEAALAGDMIRKARMAEQASEARRAADFREDRARRFKEAATKFADELRDDGRRAAAKRVVTALVDGLTHDELARFAYLIHEAGA